MNQDVAIRPVVYADAEEMCRRMNPSDLQNFSFFEKPVSLSKQQAYLAHITASSSDQMYVILYKGEMVGTCGLHEMDFHNRNARIGVMLFAKDFRGKGIGSAAIRLLLMHAFGDLRLHKVYLKVFAENTASCTKYAHLGFEFEARLRQQYCLRGEYHDMVVMSILAHNWKE